METRSEKAQAFHDLTKQLTNHSKIAFGRVPAEKLEETLGSFLGSLKQLEDSRTQIIEGEEKEDEEPKTVEVSEEILWQLLTLSCPTLSRLILQHYKRSA